MSWWITALRLSSVIILKPILIIHHLLQSHQVPGLKVIKRNVSDNKRHFYFYFLYGTFMSLFGYDMEILQLVPNEKSLFA